MSMLLLFATLAAPVQDVAPLIGREVKRIPSAASGGISDWERGEDGSTVYLRSTGRWYRVTLSGPCIDFSTSPRLLFRTHSDGSFDRFSTIAVANEPRRSCGVEMIHESGNPRRSRGG
jgi:hypothetical protein